MHKKYVRTNVHKRWTSQYRGSSSGYAESTYKPFSRNIKKFGSYRTQTQRFYGYASMPKKAYRKNIYGGMDIETELSRIARGDARAARMALARQIGRGARRIGAFTAKRIARSMIFKALMTGNDLYMIYELVTESYNALDYAVRRDFHYWDTMRTNAAGKWGHLSTDDHDWMQEAATGPKPERWVYNSDDGHNAQWYLGEPTDEEIRNQFKWLRDKKNGHWVHHDGWEHQEWIVDKKKKHHFIGRDSYKRLHGRN